MSSLNTSNNGFLYILHNECFDYYDLNTYKLGKTEDITNRMKAYTTAYLKPSTLIYISDEVKHYTLAEKMLFDQLKMYRMANNREFFKIQKEVAITCIKYVIVMINNMTDHEIINKLNEMNKPKSYNVPKIKVKSFDIYKHLTIEQKDQYKSINNENHYNIINLLKTNDFINNQNDNIVFDKIKIIRLLEKRCKIGLLDVSFNITDDPIYITDDEHNHIKKLFRCVKQKPKTMREFKIFYIGLLRHLADDIINIKQIGKRKISVYSLNEELIKYHLEFCKMGPLYNNLHDDIKIRFQIT
jgi:hypothetical protein